MCFSGDSLTLAATNGHVLGKNYPFNFDNFSAIPKATLIKTISLLLTTVSMFVNDDESSILSLSSVLPLKLLPVSIN